MKNEFRTTNFVIDYRLVIIRTLHLLLPLFFHIITNRRFSFVLCCWSTTQIITLLFIFFLLIQNFIILSKRNQVGKRHDYDLLTCLVLRGKCD